MDEGKEEVEVDGAAAGTGTGTGVGVGTTAGIVCAGAAPVGAAAVPIGVRLCDAIFDGLCMSVLQLLAIT